MLDNDGWLHTGDIGAILTNGTVRMVDRRKNIFKLSQGEYVAPEKIETICCEARFVAQAWVYGDSLQNAVVAVIVPDRDVLLAWANERGKPSDWASLCADPEATRAVLQDLYKTARDRQLASFEIPRAIHLEADPFSVENDLLTPTFKLKRTEVRAKYRDVVTRLYASLATAPPSSPHRS